MHDFHYDEMKARRETPLVRAWMLRAWSIEHQPFSSVEPITDGYVAAEVERLMNKSV